MPKMQPEVEKKASERGARTGLCVCMAHFDVAFCAGIRAQTEKEIDQNTLYEKRKYDDSGVQYNGVKQSDEETNK